MMVALRAASLPIPLFSHQEFPFAGLLEHRYCHAGEVWTKLLVVTIKVASPYQRIAMSRSDKGPMSHQRCTVLAIFCYISKIASVSLSVICVI